MRSPMSGCTRPVRHCTPSPIWTSCISAAPECFEWRTASFRGMGMHSHQAPTPLDRLWPVPLRVRENLKHWPPQRGFFRVVDIDLGHISNDPPTKLRTSRMPCNDTAYARNADYRSQLYCS